MGSNDLKLMVDYCLKDPEIIKELEQFKSLDIKTTIECGYRQNATDKTLIWTGTIAQDRILLTRDFQTIDEHKFTPCRHGGVIIIHHRRPDANVVRSYMKAFLQSGIRKYAKNHVSHLKRDGARIVTHKEPQVCNYNENPNLRKITK